MARPRDVKVPLTGTGANPYFTAEGGYIPTSEPTFPRGPGCRCIAPRIYVDGQILDVCQRCGWDVRRR